MGVLSQHIRSNAVGYVAVFLALTGSAAALQGRNSVNSGDIKPRNVKRSDLAPNSVDSTKVRNGALLGEDFAPGQLPQGPQGATGPQGPAGSPDTSQEVLDKLKQADGAGSGLDADSLDGLDSSAFLPAGTMVTGRRLIDDPTPGDGSSKVGTPYLTDTVSVDVSCAQDIFGGTDERATISIFKRPGSDPISISAWRTTGTTGSGVNLPEVSTGFGVLDVQSTTNTVGSVYFVAASPNGKVTTGSVSAEVDDTQAPAGTDCTFAGNVFAQ